MPDEPVALVVNAGGQSRRMGRTKALLPLPGSGKPLILHIIHSLLPLVDDSVIVVTNDPLVAEVVHTFKNSPVALRVVADLWPDGGALGGLATGLTGCMSCAMVVACDMPFVDRRIFAKLIAAAEAQPHCDALIPHVAGQAEPFHGVWRRRCLPRLEARLATGELGVQAALATLQVAWMDEDALGIGAETLAFANVNSLEEWQAVQLILEKQAGPVTD